MYKRKTEDEFEIQGWYPTSGWECLTTETNRKDARSNLKAYNENEPGVSHRIVRKRVPIEAKATTPATPATSRTAQ